MYLNEKKNTKLRQIIACRKTKKINESFSEENHEVDQKEIEKKTIIMTGFNFITKIGKKTTDSGLYHGKSFCTFLLRI